MRFGLLGAKLGHSVSPRIHAAFGLPDYTLFEAQPGELPSLLQESDWGGLNVTIPYKKAVLPHCHTLSEAVRRTGNANTLVFGSDGHITAHNTDYAGLAYLAQRAGITFDKRKILILGSGGTAQTARALAEDQGAGSVVLVSRGGPVTYADLAEHADADILINATPVGMFPNNEACPVDIGLFSHLFAVIDAIYRPLRTELLLRAQARGLIAAGGLLMLVEQARLANELFTGRSIAQSETDAVYRELLFSLCNIVLVGMPGAGKTTIGQALAETTSRPFFDTDRCIEEQTGQTPGDILRRQGETPFRTIETAVVRQIYKNQGCVIATGGGTPLSAENRRLLLQNGVIVYLERALALLSTQNRPLSQNLGSLFAEREPVYRAFASLTVSNNASISDAAQNTLSAVKALT